MAKSYTTKYDNKRIEVRKRKDGSKRIYAHEAKCDGKLVAILPYSYDADGNMVYLLRGENVSCWAPETTVDGYYSITCIHGMMDKAKETPAQAAQRELYEEAGYRVSPGEIVPLGVVPISKLEDSLYYLFTVRVPSEEIVFNEALTGPTDGTKNERSAFSFWSPTVEDAVDPLVYTLCARIDNYLRQNISERVVLEIDRPSVDTERKFSAAVGHLQKALHFDVETPEAEHSVHREKSVYRSMNELHDRVIEAGDSGLYEAYRRVGRMLGVLTKAADDSFRIGAKRYINLGTGRPLTEAEWVEIEEQITQIFGEAFRGMPDMLVIQAMALGKVLAYMEVDEAKETPLRDIRLTERELEELPYAASLVTARQAAASYITGISDDARSMIHQTILNSTRSQWDISQLERELFEGFSDLNKDWRRIAATETQYNFQNGYLIATGVRDATAGRDYSLLLGASDATACEWCWGHINGKVFALVSQPPVGDETVIINGRRFEAIWPGKSNIGRKRGSWHVCVPAHPFCRCSLQAVTELSLPTLLAGAEESTAEKQEERNALEGTFRE